MNIQNLDFKNWTEYDDWLIQNYDKYALTSVNEEQGIIKIQFIDKEEWNNLSDEQKTADNFQN